MILKLMRLDAAAEDAGKHLLMAVGLASLLNLIATLEMELPPLFSRETTVGWRFLEGFVFWMMLVATTAGAKFWIRAPQYLLGLPLHGRDLLTARLLGQVMHGLAVLVVGFLAASLRWGGGAPSLTASTWDAFPLFAALSLLLIVLPTAIEPTLRKLTMNAPMIVLVGLQWVAALVVASALPWHPGIGIAALALAVFALVAVIRRAPANLELELLPTGTAAAEPAPAAVTSPTAPEAAFRAARPARPDRRLLLRTLLRVMHGHWLGWLLPFVLAVYGIILVEKYREGDDSLFYGTYVIFFFLGAMAQSLKRLHRTDAWPVSRRTLYWLAIGPSLAAYVLGLGLTLLVPDRQGPVMYRPGVVDVPHEFKGLARDGEVPAAVAPWGESHTPRGYPVLPGLDWRVYRPYEYAEDNSVRFIAWLADEALAAVHGETPDDPRRVQFAERDSTFERNVRTKRFMVPFSRERETAAYSRAVAAEVMLMIVIGLGLCVVSLFGFHARWASRRKKLGMLGVGIPFAVAALLTLAQLSGWSAMWAAPAAAMILIRQGTDAMGGAPWQWWLAAAATALAALLVMQERFVGLEANMEECRRRRANEL